MKHVALVMLVCLVALTAGCSYLKPNPERKIIGQWESPREAPKLIIRIAADHQFVVSHPDRSAAGAWSYKDGAFTLVVKEDAAKNIKGETAQGVIDDQGRLTITPQSGKVVVMTKTKKTMPKPADKPKTTK